jgi:ATP-dependent DNA helicase PIF1
MKILIFNNENIYSPISLKTFIIKKYKLNNLQFFVFEIFIKMNSTNQLLQYIGGATSIGKTQIIKAIKEYFLKTNNKDKLRITTYTTNAISLIGGTTIHSLLGLSIDKNTIINKSKTIPNSWSDIQFMIVDEISMVGCIMFVTMQLKLQKLKSSILPFGGLHIILMKDFKTFPPIIDTSLFSIDI